MHTVTTSTSGTCGRCPFGYSPDPARAGEGTDGSPADGSR